MAQFQNVSTLKMKTILLLLCLIIFCLCQNDAGTQWNTDGHQYSLREKLVFGQGRRRQTRPYSQTVTRTRQNGWSKIVQSENNEY